MRDEYAVESYVRTILEEMDHDELVDFALSTMNAFDLRQFVESWMPVEPGTTD